MNNPLNIFILNTPHDSWENYLIEDFKKKNLAKNIIVQKAAGESKKKFLKLGSEGLRGQYRHIPNTIYNNLYGHLYQFMDMYSRVSLHNSGNYNELNVHQFLDHFNLMINYYYNLFIENEIDLFIHNNSPHVGYDYIPHLLAEELGIKTLYLEQTQFPNKFFYYWKFNDFGEFKTAKNLFEHGPTIQLENKFEKDLPYMKLNRRDGFQLSSFKNWKSFNRDLNSYVPEYQLFKDLLKSRYRGQAYYRYKLKKQYAKNGKRLRKEVDLNEPFVYFPLHLQPEKTTSSFGGKYSDQVLALEHLSSILPANWKLYVKENPKQTYFMRNPEFFRRLERIPNLEFVSPEYNTYDLIRNAKVCATITGTVGWEAITGGKPAVIFGWGVWYKSLPGVYQFSFDLDLKNISSKKVDFEELQSKFEVLNGKLAPGIVLNEYYPSIYEGYDKEENNIQVTKSLETIIKSKFK